MPLDPAASTARPWVAVYAERAASNRIRNDDPPPSYEEATRAPSPEPRRLPSSRAIPRVVGNEPPAWRLRFSRRPHPDAQQRELQAQLERRERTERKLDNAYRQLDRVLLRHANLWASGRAYCGGGLFDDDECSVISNARSEIAHYEEKKRDLQEAHAALMRRNAARLSPE